MRSNFVFFDTLNVENAQRTTNVATETAGAGKLGRSKVGLGKLGLGKLGFGKVGQ